MMDLRLVVSLLLVIFAALASGCQLTAAVALHDILSQ